MLTKVYIFLDARDRSRPKSWNAPEPVVFRDLVHQLAADAKVVEYINAYDVSGDYRRIRFTDGIQSGSEWVSTAVQSVQSVQSQAGGYRVSRYNETVTARESRTMTNPDVIHICTSATVQWHGWTVSFTLTKQCDIVSVTQHRHMWIKPGEAKNFLASPNWELADWYTCTFTGTDPSPDVHGMYEYLLGWMPENEHNDWIRSIVEYIGSPNADLYLIPGNMKLVHKFARLLPRAIELSLDQWYARFGLCTGQIHVRKKIDGLRQLLVIRDGRVSVWRGGAVEHDVKADLPRVERKGLYIFDTEYAEDCWWVLHTIVDNGESLLTVSDEKRAAATARLAGGQLVPCPGVITSRDNIETAVKAVWREGMEGMLITLEAQEGYWQQIVVKWKSASEITIDFVVVRCPANLEGQVPYVRAAPDHTIYILMVGCHINRASVPRILKMQLPRIGDYQLVPFIPPQRPSAHVFSSARPDLEGHVCELIEIANSWVLKRIRTDKRSILRGGNDMGNNVAAAQDTYLKYSQPFKFENLYSHKSLEQTRIPDGIITPGVSCVVLYRPPASLVPPRGVPHILTIGPKSVNVRGVRTIEEPRGGAPDFPSEFVGAAQVVISYEIAPSGAKRWGKIMNLITAPGGFVYHLGREPELPSLGDEYARKESKHLCWKRTVATHSLIPTPVVHKTNSHCCGNSVARYGFKYSRLKNRDIVQISTPEAKQTLIIDEPRGELLCYIEFLLRIPVGSQVMFGESLHSGHPELLQRLFPDHKYVKTGKDAEAYIAKTWTKEEVERIMPRYALLYMMPTDEKVFQIPRSNIHLIPYLDQGNPAVMLYLTSKELRTRWWNIHRSVWIEELKYFHNVYRPSAFYYTKPADFEGFDHCYDCHTEIYIMTKYARVAKTTLDRAVDLLG